VSKVQGGSNLWLVYRAVGASPNGASLKTTPGQIGGWAIGNTANAVRYVKLYDTAGVPDATYTPLLTIAIPPGGLPPVLGSGAIEFSQGVAVRVTVGLADNDNTAPGISDVMLQLFWR
jgi:hypothetical protein